MCRLVFAADGVTKTCGTSQKKLEIAYCPFNWGSPVATADEAPREPLDNGPDLKEEKILCLRNTFCIPLLPTALVTERFFSVNFDIV